MSASFGVARGAAGRVRAWREALLLEDAERTAAGYADGARDRMRALVRAGADRALVADQAFDGHPAAALALYREAALFYMAARVAVSGELLDEPLVAERVVARFQALPARHPPPCGPIELEGFYASVCEGGLRAEADDVQTLRKAERARAVVRWLATLLEPRGVDELKFVRRVRLGAVAVLALALVARTIASLGGEDNIALHKPVTMSGVHPASSAAPGGLTDGVTTGAPYGAHTTVSDSPWVEVDLQAVYALDRVAIYNRGDGFYEDDLPLTLQLSEDGRRFVDVETRTKLFTQIAPWVAKLHGAPARYVRVRGVRGKYVALSELEAFGRRRR
jgi:hypothetical protein